MYIGIMLYFPFLIDDLDWLSGLLSPGASSQAHVTWHKVFYFPVYPNITLHLNVCMHACVQAVMHKYYVYQCIDIANTVIVDL